MPETRESLEARLKRLKMRSWRRGIKEMDMILGPHADSHLEGMSIDELAQYDALLEENDQDLYRWFSGQDPAPERFSALVEEILEKRRRAR